VKVGDIFYCSSHVIFATSDLSLRWWKSKSTIKQEEEFKRMKGNNNNKTGEIGGFPF